jgi:hypothetical protein
MSEMKDERPAIRHFAMQPYSYAIDDGYDILALVGPPSNGIRT